jgi:hypothetical protein
MKMFTNHPNSVGESYIQHFYTALKYSVLFVMLAVTALIHALLPFLFIDTASKKICKLAKEMEERNAKQDR